MEGIFGDLFSLVLVINIVLALLVVGFERRNPASTWAWLFILLFIPVVGFFGYLMFGQDARKHRSFYIKSKNDRYLQKEYIRKYVKGGTRPQVTAKEQMHASKAGVKLLPSPEYNSMEDLAFLNLAVGSELTYNNRVELFFDGKKKFDSLIDDIRNARHFIFMEYYIIRNDSLGIRVVMELAAKAAEGVEVKLLYDGMGCIKLPSKFFSPIVDAGGSISSFFPPLFPLINVRLNYRNHRKICVIDGNIGYVGGFNIGEEYLGLVKRFGHWRDTHLRIDGQAVQQLTVRFLMDWNFSSEGQASVDSKYFPVIPCSHEVDKPNDTTENTAIIQIVSSGPDTSFDNILNGYFKMMNEAQKSIYFITPYFVPTDGIINALKVAALSGIDVRVIFPAHPDHLFVYWASLSYLGELLSAGVRCFQYTNGFIHSKAIFIDGNVCSVGTANMDIRSFSLNFEVNAFIYDKELTQTLEAEFINDLSFSEEITWEKYMNRSVVVKVKEAVSRLISPIL